VVALTLATKIGQNVAVGVVKTTRDDVVTVNVGTGGVCHAPILPEKSAGRNPLGDIFLS
jgi:hypothetical protein